MTLADLSDILAIGLTFGLGAFAGRYIYLCCQDEKNGKQQK
jgi:hypothetical protein